MKKVMMPTPELKALLLKELTTQHDLQKLCLKWDIPFEDINNYSLYLPSSQTPVPDSKVGMYTQPAGYNKPRLRTNNRISNFG
jgi:hypothetical protein